MAIGVVVDMGKYLEWLLNLGFPWPRDFMFPLHMALVAVVVIWLALASVQIPSQAPGVITLLTGAMVGVGLWRGRF